MTLRKIYTNKKALLSIGLFITLLTFSSFKFWNPKKEITQKQRQLLAESKGSDWLEKDLDGEVLKHLAINQSTKPVSPVSMKFTSSTEPYFSPSERMVKAELQTISTQKNNFDLSIAPGTGFVRLDPKAKTVFVGTERKVWLDLCRADLLESQKRFRYSATAIIENGNKLTPPLTPSDSMVITMRPNSLYASTLHVLIRDNRNQHFLKVFDPLSIESSDSGILVCPFSQFFNLEFYKSEKPIRSLKTVSIITTAVKAKSVKNLKILTISINRRK